MRMYLKDDAKVISNRDIEMIRHIIVSKHSDEFPAYELFTGQYSSVSNDGGDQYNYTTLIMNKGLMATILGYDAVDCLNKNEDNTFMCYCKEMVVVNRSKLVVCDEVILI